MHLQLIDQKQSFQSIRDGMKNTITIKQREIQKSREIIFFRLTIIVKGHGDFRDVLLLEIDVVV